MEERKRKIRELFAHPSYRPMRLRELASLLEVPRERRGELEETLEALLEEGTIVLSKRGKYSLPQEESLTGCFIGNKRGFGFVRTGEGTEDIFIPEAYVGGALHSDQVEVKLLPAQRGRRMEGRITQVLSRGFTELIGTYEEDERYGFVIPDNDRICVDIFVRREHAQRAKDGDKVVVRLLHYGEGRRNPEGEIVQVLGAADETGIDVLSVAMAYGLSLDFPEEVKRQAKWLPGAVTEEIARGRLDLRDWLVVTIDGEDSRDFDDAISIRRKGSGYELGVHIADVTEYVTEDSPLDQEARRRGTSVYFPDRVLPMLPVELSNGICSLNEGVDRLTLSCLMQIDERGEVTGHTLAETVIRSRHRLTYDEADRILAGTETTSEEEKELLLLLDECARLLRARRKKRGSLDFGIPETRLVLDEQGIPVVLMPYERNEAMRLIEDLMLLANETVAEAAFWQELPFLYRSHETPDENKLRSLRRMIGNFGYHVRLGGSGEVHPKELQKLLVEIMQTPEEALISRLTLRALKRAQYTTSCLGHFGLASRYYCHFTSPIRRYPDLQIHRILKDSLHGRLDAERLLHYEERLAAVAHSSSETERTAQEAEREVERIKKCQYMERHVGEAFEGVISGVAAFGFFVELDNTAEGVVRCASLRGDYFFLDEEKQELVGEMTGIRYRLGQRVRVKCQSASRISREVELILLPAQEEQGETPS